MGQQTRSEGAIGDDAAGGPARTLAQVLAFTAGVAVVIGGLGGVLVAGDLGGLTWRAWDLVLVLSFAAAWLVGGALLRTRPRIGTVVVVVSALVALQGMVPTLMGMVTDPGSRGGQAGLALAAQAPYAPMIAAGVAAWLGRPTEGWGVGRGTPRVVAAPLALSFLPAVMPEVLSALPGRTDAPAGGWFATHLVGPTMTAPASVAVTRVVVAVAIAGVLIVAATSLRRGLAGVLLLTVALPQAVGGFGSLFDAWGDPALLVGPAGYLTLAAVVTLLVVGMRWLVEDHTT